MVTTEAVAGSTTEGGEGFEASLLRDGQLRWFWIRQVALGTDAIGSTVVILSDISERKARQRRSEQIQRATWRLMDVEDCEEVADIAVETASQVFQLPLSAIYLSDDEADRLRRIAVTDGASDAFGPDPHLDRGDESGLARLTWHVYE